MSAARIWLGLGVALALAACGPDASEGGDTTVATDTTGATDTGGATGATDATGTTTDATGLATDATGPTTDATRPTETSTTTDATSTTGPTTTTDTTVATDGTPGDTTEVPETGDLFVTLPDVGSVRATLHPIEAAPLGTALTVSFGVPFPRGVVTDIGRVRVTDATSGAELPAHVAPLATWRDLGGDGPESVRAALVQVAVTFADRTPRALDVHWGAAPASALARQGDPWATWAPIGDAPGFFPDAYPAADGVREPLVYTTLPPAWLGAAILRTRTEPFGTDAAWAFFDDAAPAYARTGVNDVDPRVTIDNQIDYLGDREPWLFDRALTLFNMYVRSGDVAWLRHAHRATQFYAAHVGGDGFFDLAPGDMKYAYGGAMLVDLMLTGDTRHLPKIAAVGDAADGWDVTYTPDTGFWTERHQAYTLLAKLVSWEASGDATHGQQATRLARETFRMAREPAGGWTAQGCTLHIQDAHEGDGVQEPICSPWMGALLAEAAFRYYIHSGDSEALGYLAGLGDFVTTYGSGPEGDGLSPYYLVSSYLPSDEPDIEHTCDVAGLVARAAWARRALGGDAATLEATARGLVVNCAVILDEWHRPGGPDAGLSEWRLSPPRKLNWWFGTTLDLPWLLALP